MNKTLRIVTFCLTMAVESIQLEDCLCRVGMEGRWIIFDNECLDMEKEVVDKEFDIDLTCVEKTSSLYSGNSSQVIM